MPPTATDLLSPSSALTYVISISACWQTTEVVQYSRTHPSVPPSRGTVNHVKPRCHSAITDSIAVQNSSPFPPTLIYTDSSPVVLPPMAGQTNQTNLTETMSKVSFRTRQIDFNRPLPIVKYGSDMFFELGEGTFVGRGVPQVPSGMEREEENEHHFLEVIQALQLQKPSDVSIPVPEIIDRSEEYEKTYTMSFSPPKHLIHIRTIALAEEEPIEYDMDTDDEDWLHRSDLNLSPEKFESMMDRLERGCGQRVMNLEEARLLLKDDPSLVIAVYDYWLNKRIQCRQPLLLSVRQEKRDAGSNNDPYVAFRRRTERMQTRKNRKNDEYSYEKMLILREQMNVLGEIMSRLVKREATKESLLETERRLFQLRYHLGDWDCVHLSEADAVAQKSPKSFERVLNAHSKKMPHRSLDATKLDSCGVSDEEQAQPTESDPFAFIRLPGCKYQRPLDLRTAGFGDEEFETYRLTTVPRVTHENRQRYTGYVRRRLGRGGRIILDRVPPPSEELAEFFLQVDTADPPIQLDRTEIRRWVPVNNYVKPLDPDRFPRRSSLSRRIFDDRSRCQPQTLAQRLRLSLLRDPPDNVLALAFSRLSKWAYLPVSQSIPFQQKAPDMPARQLPNSLACLPDKSFSLLQRGSLAAHASSSKTGGSIQTDTKSSEIQRPDCPPVAKLRSTSPTSMKNVALASGCPDPQTASTSSAKTANSPLIKSGIKVSISPSGVNGSRRDNDDFDWLPQLNSGLNPTDCSRPVDENKKESQNGIIPANTLMYNI
ncbi:hypothetical protein AAHC03_0713 [Spirometra sp. Aus1]